MAMHFTDWAVLALCIAFLGSFAGDVVRSIAFVWDKAFSPVFRAVDQCFVVTCGEFVNEVARKECPAVTPLHLSLALFFAGIAASLSGALLALSEAPFFVAYTLSVEVPIALLMIVAMALEAWKTLFDEKGRRDTVRWKMRFALLLLVGAVMGMRIYGAYFSGYTRGALTDTFERVVSQLPVAGGAYAEAGIMLTLLGFLLYTASVYIAGIRVKAAS